MSAVEQTNDALESVTIDEAAADFLERLVATPSVSGSEREAVEGFIAQARTLGLRAWMDEAGNGIAERGPEGEAERDIVLLGHIDTVPGTLRVRREGPVLHGRGAVDAKGPLAAMLFAAARASIGPGVRVRIAAAVGEETPHSFGARYLAEIWRPDACIIGEPSGWEGVTLGYKGRLVATLGVERTTSHSAGPDGSACDALLAWRERMTSALPAQDDSLSAFERVQHTVRRLASSSDGLIERAEMTIGLRLPPGITPGAVRAIITSCAPGDGWFEAEGDEQAHLSPRSDPVVAALTAAVRAMGGRPTPKRKTGTSDMNVVAPVWKCPIAAYGPGDSALDHTPRERIDLRELTVSIGVLEGALGALDRVLEGQ